MINKFYRYQKTMKIISLYYHDPIIEGVEKMIIYYQKRGFRFISVVELLAIMQEGKPLQEKLAFISLDDGWKQNFELLPIIEKYHVPVCIFVATEPVLSGNFWWEYVSKFRDKRELEEFKKLPYKEFYRQLEEMKSQIKLKRSAMTKEEVIAISHHPLVSIQAHTVNHPILTTQPDDVVEMEMREGKKILEEWIGKEVFAFSYPNGRNTCRESNMARKYYDIAFTTKQKHIHIGKDIMLLPRYGLTGQWPRDLFKAWGLWKVLKMICVKLGVKRP